jgi:F-type H+-transporting ATPase subunit c
MKGEKIVRRFSVFLLVTLAVLCVASPVFAQEPGAAGAQWRTITAGFAMAIASSMCAMAQGRAISAACEGLARNPGAAAAIRFALLLGLVLIESLALYTLLIIFIKT